MGNCFSKADDSGSTSASEDSEAGDQRVRGGGFRARDAGPRSRFRVDDDTDAHGRKENKKREKKEDKKKPEHRKKKETKGWWSKWSDFSYLQMNRNWLHVRKSLITMAFLGSLRKESPMKVTCSHPELIIVDNDEFMTDRMYEDMKFRSKGKSKDKNYDYGLDWGMFFGMGELPTEEDGMPHKAFERLDSYERDFGKYDWRRLEETRYDREVSSGHGGFFGESSSFGWGSDNYGSSSGWNSGSGRNDDSWWRGRSEPRVR
jgi:hypothetical protein